MKRYDVIVRRYEYGLFSVEVDDYETINDAFNKANESLSDPYTEIEWAGRVGIPQVIYVESLDGKEIKHRED